jgi:DNA recombination protein RmuC
MDFFEWLPLALALLNLVLILWLGLRANPSQQRASDDLKSSFQAANERTERELRDELGRSAQGTRLELGSALSTGLSTFQQSLLNQQGVLQEGSLKQQAMIQEGVLKQQAAVAQTQNEQIASFRTQLAAMQAAVAAALQSASGTQTLQAQASREAQDMSLKRFSDSVGEQLRALSEANERRLGEVKTTVEQRLTTLQQGNELKLEQMRATVDEKLQATLEARLGESFKQVADRLEQVHRGLGEMQVLAKDVGALNRVLTNVKSRGVFGEVQLAGLLEQVFTPEQYATNVETVPGSGARVEFAIKLPGRRGCQSTRNFRVKTTSVCWTRKSAPTRLRPTLQARRLSSGFGWRRNPFAKNMWPHPTPLTSRFCLCPPKACMPRRCDGPV